MIINHKVYVWIRTNLNWSTMTKEKLVEHNKKMWHASKTARIMESIEKMDSMITPSFFEMRHMLTEVARVWLEGNRSIRGILRSPEEILKLNDEDYVIPMDDDDFLHRNIGEMVKEYPQDDIIIWNQLKIRDLKFIPQHVLKMPQPVRTNNTAIRASIMKDLVKNFKDFHRHGRLGKKMILKEKRPYRFHDGGKYSLLQRSPFCATDCASKRPYRFHKKLIELQRRARNFTESERTSWWGDIVKEQLRNVFTKMELT